MWGLVFGLLIYQLSVYGTDQINVQRYFATKSLRHTIKATIGSALILLPVLILLYGFGVGLVAYYQEHPELQATLKSADRVMPHFTINLMPVGFRGLVIAGIFAATMSSMSSGINSLTTSTMKDLLERLRPGIKSRERFWARTLSVLWGLAATCGALLMVDIKLTILERFNFPHKRLTDAHPMRELLSLAHRAEGEVLSVTVSGGGAYSDVPEVGPSVLVLTDNQPASARRHAKEIAGRMWELRGDFTPRLPGVREAVKRAVESERAPVIRADVGDNIGAGTPGVGTFILRELFTQGAEGALVIIADPESVAGALEAGVGQSVTLRVGGKSDTHHGEPVTVEGRVRLISDGAFRNRGHMRDGIVEQMGRTAVVESRGVKLVLTEVKMPPWNLEQLRSVGISPEHARIIALKSAVAFRTAYEPLAGEIIEVNSPGLSAVDLSRFNFQHIRRPLYPLDPM